MKKTIFYMLFYILLGVLAVCTIKQQKHTLNKTYYCVAQIKDKKINNLEFENCFTDNLDCLSEVNYYLDSSCVQINISGIENE